MRSKQTLTDSTPATNRRPAPTWHYRVMVIIIMILKRSPMVFHALTFAGSRGSCLNTSVQISSRDPTNVIAMKLPWMIVVLASYDSNGKVPYKLFTCDGKPTWRLVQNVVYNDASCAMTLWRHHKILKCYVQGDNVTSLNVTLTKQCAHLVISKKFKIHVQTTLFMIWTWVLLFEHSFWSIQE